MTKQANQPAFVSDIEWDAIEGGNTEFAAQYPRLQWFHGSPQAAGFMKSGGLFISHEEYPDFTADGFTPTTAVTRDGTELAGAAASRTHLAVIRIKHQWIVTDEGRNVPLAHVLCVVKGCPDLVCISLRGAAKALDFQKAFNAHMSQNVALANRTRPEGRNPLEPFALWFPLIAGESQTITAKNGKDKSVVTLPTLEVPQVLDRNYVATLWVGRENYQTFAGYFRETDTWQRQPIWEQRIAEPEPIADPTHSGPTDHGPITESQIQHIVGLCDAKGLDVKQLVLTATNGYSSNIGTLTRQEASQIIETAKGY